MSSKEGQTVIEFRDVVRTYGEEEALQYAVNHINFTMQRRLDLFFSFIT